MGIQVASSPTTTTVRHGMMTDNDDDGDGVIGDNGTMGDGDG